MMVYYRILNDKSDMLAHLLSDGMLAQLDRLAQLVKKNPNFFGGIRIIVFLDPLKVPPSKSF